MVADDTVTGAKDVDTGAETSGDVDTSGTGNSGGYYEESSSSYSPPPYESSSSGGGGRDDSYYSYDDDSDDGSADDATTTTAATTSAAAGTSNNTEKVDDVLKATTALNRIAPGKADVGASQRTRISAPLVEDVLESEDTTKNKLDKSGRAARPSLLVVQSPDQGDKPVALQPAEVGVLPSLVPTDKEQVVKGSAVETTTVEGTTVTRGKGASKGKRADRRRYEVEYALVFHNHCDEATEKSVNKAVSRRLSQNFRSKVDAYSYYRRHIISKLRNLGLKVFQSLSRDQDEILVKITAPVAVLEEMAERMKMRVRLNKLSAVGDDDPMHIRDKDLKLIDGGFAPFRRSIRHLLEPFTEAQREQLVYHLISAPAYQGGAGINLRHEVSRNRIVRFFAVHKPATQGRLRKAWVHTLFTVQPLQAVREYLGEKAALYFAFHGFYTVALAIPAALGLAAFVIGVVLSTFDNWVTPVYSFVFILWITLLLEFWKRQNAALGLNWDLHGFEEREPTRPEFEGKRRAGFHHSKSGMFVHLKDGDFGLQKDELPQALWYDPWVAFGKRVASWVFMFLMVAVVIGITIAVLLARIELEQQWSPNRTENDIPWAGIVVGSVHGILIAVLNFVYRILARQLNNWENHRTETRFENHLILKIVIFQFTNSFALLFYIAFFKEQFEVFGRTDRCVPDCMTELTVQLGSVLITGAGVNLIVDSLLPYVKYKLRIKAEDRKLYKMVKGDADMLKKLRLTEIEKQAKLEEYDGTVEDYAALVLQFGYLSLFAAAFPLGASIAFLTNFFGLRERAHKILFLSSRPRALKVPNIGLFYHIFNFIGFAAIITNSVLLFFTSNMFKTFGLDESLNTTENKILGALVIEHGLVFLKLVVRWLIPDMPRHVTRKLAKQEFVSDWLFDEANDTQWSIPDPPNADEVSDFEVSQLADVLGTRKRRQTGTNQQENGQETEKAKGQDDKDKDKDKDKGAGTADDGGALTGAQQRRRNKLRNRNNNKKNNNNQYNNNNNNKYTVGYHSDISIPDLV